MTSDPTPAQSDYDDFAAEYTVANENGLFNRYLERPEVLRMVGDVEGLRVLDAGCGAGPLLAELRDRGAEVSGFDLSTKMIDLARERLGSEADLRVADLSDPLPYADGEFDVVVVSLALHYVRNWERPLAEFRRVLKPGGRLVISLLHPAIYAFVHHDKDYFEVAQYSEDYEFDGRTVWLTYWHRPLQDVVNSFVRGGFTIREMTEPGVVPDTPQDLLPPDGRTRFLCFLFFDLQKV